MDLEMKLCEVVQKLRMRNKYILSFVRFSNRTFLRVIYNLSILMYNSYFLYKNERKRKKLHLLGK